MEVAIVSMRLVLIYIGKCLLTSMNWGRGCLSLFHFIADTAICGLV